MKRSSTIIGLAIALVASCSTQEKDFQEPLQGDVFYASFEQPAEEGTKVYANENLHLRWNADDRVSIFNEVTYNQQYQFAGETGANAGEFQIVNGDVFVTGNRISHVVSVYPYQKSTKITEEEVLTVTLPAEQSYAEKTFGLGANTMVSVSSGNVLQYKNAGGYLVLKLYGEGVSVSSLVLKGNSGEKLAGEVSVTMPLDGVPTMKMTTEATTVITLTCETPVRLGATVGESTEFWFVVPPTTFSRGFSVQVVDAQGASHEMSTSKSVVIERNKLTKMGAFAISNLSAGGTANCYVISSPGSYMFNASVKGNSTESVGSPVKADVLWETFNSDTAPSVGGIVKDVVFSDGVIRFSATGANGNALIAVKDKENKILWSWHIWVCKDYDPSSASQLYSGKSAAMMDRNLGALSAAADNTMTNGLFYQWGRKDPFPGAIESYVASANGGHLMKTTKGDNLAAVSSESVAATVDYAIEYPDVFITTTKNNGDWLAKPNDTLWGQTKTIHDPCPAGWRVPAAYVLNSNSEHVPAKEAWSNLSYVREPGTSSNKIYGVYLDNGKAWYPNNGYISLAGKLLMVGQYSCYWSCSLNSRATYAMEMSQTSSTNLTFKEYQYGKVRGEGHSVRCIKE